jgi:hypothetical protein
MSFNTTTGALGGTPSTVASATTYTITGTNTSGSTTQTFSLTVTAAVVVVDNSGAQAAAQAEVARKAREQQELIEILSNEFPVGPDATNATGALYGILGDDVLFDRLGDLAKANPDGDARQVILARMDEMIGYPGIEEVLSQVDSSGQPETPVQQNPEEQPQTPDEQNPEEQPEIPSVNESDEECVCEEGDDDCDCHDTKNLGESKMNNKQKLNEVYDINLAEILKQAGLSVQSNPSPDYENGMAKYDEGMDECEANPGVVPDQLLDEDDRDQWVIYGDLETGGDIVTSTDPSNDQQWLFGRGTGEAEDFLDYLNSGGKVPPPQEEWSSEMFDRFAPKSQSMTDEWEDHEGFDEGMGRLQELAGMPMMADEGAVGSLVGGALGTAAGAKLGSMAADALGAGTLGKMAGGVAGAALGGYGGSKLGDKVGDWIDPDEPEEQDQEQNQVNELSKKTLGSYAKKARADYGVAKDQSASNFSSKMNKKAMDHSKQLNPVDRERSEREIDRLGNATKFWNNKADKRSKGIDRAVDRLTNEEQSAEVSESNELNLTRLKELSGFLIK